MIQRARLIRVENVLLHVDDIAIVERFDDTPLISMEGAEYKKGLQISLRDGRLRRIETDATVDEFAEAYRTFFVNTPDKTGLDTIRRKGHNEES